MKTGGGTQTTTADLPADWRRTMDDETREALMAFSAERNIKDDEFTAKDAVGIWCNSPRATRDHLDNLVKEGAVTMRKAYNPETKGLVNAYKIVQ